MNITTVHMNALMRPKGIAVVGATDRAGSVGRSIFYNIVDGNWASPTNEKLTNARFGTSAQYPNLNYRVFPINPKRDELAGFKVYHTVSSIEDKENVDLALICVPAKHCPDVLRDCAKLGTIRAAILIPAGFKEVGEEGLKLELECVKIAQEANIGLTGPNCLGVQSPNFRLNASFASDCAIPGHIAFISQSGAICTALLDWSLKKKIGFSAFVSLGSMSHVEWCHWIDYCGEDKETHAVVMYMETIGDADQFLKVAQRVAQQKPVVVIKAGKTAEASAAAVSHTGSLTGTYDNFLSAMERAGVLVLNAIDELQNVIDLLSTAALRRSKAGNKAFSEVSENVVIITNAGGPGVLATDAVSGSGLKMLLPLPAELKSELDGFLPPAWSHSNPIDVLGDADDVCYKRALESTFKVAKHVPGGLTVLVVLSPQSVTKPKETAEHVADLVNKTENAPYVVCSWMGGDAVQSGRDHLRQHHIPCFDQPDTAANTIGLLCKQRRLAAGATPIEKPSANKKARQLIAELQKTTTENDSAREGLVSLSEHDSKMVLKAYGIRVTESVRCSSAAEAVKAVSEVGGYPVVMKVHGGKFTHKSDIGGVKLNLASEDQVKQAYEEIKKAYEALDPKGFEGVTVQPMIGTKRTGNNSHPCKQSTSPELLIGSVNDVQFGPMVMFGSGGTYVEIYKDTATTLAPVDAKGAEALVAKTNIAAAILGEERGRYASADPKAVYDTISKFSQLCADLKDEVAECEMNPVIVTDDNQLLALDARVVIRK